MRNIEKYEKAVLDSLNYCDLDIKIENADTGLKKDCIERNCNACKKQLREWLLAEAEILDNAEKRYLRGVIRPFRDKVRYILKISDDDFEEEYIIMFTKESGNVTLPRFDENTMYKGMELGKEYTLKELGLDND
nr:MAG TPA: hypothetical protein [Caudoviricetes sp.]